MSSQRRFACSATGAKRSPRISSLVSFSQSSARVMSATRPDAAAAASASSTHDASAGTTCAHASSRVVIAARAFSCAAASSAAISFACFSMRSAAVFTSGSSAVSHAFHAVASRVVSTADFLRLTTDAGTRRRNDVRLDIAPTAVRCVSSNRAARASSSFTRFAVASRHGFPRSPDEHTGHFFGWWRSWYVSADPSSCASSRASAAGVPVSASCAATALRSASALRAIASTSIGSIATSWRIAVPKDSSDASAVASSLRSAARSGALPSSSWRAFRARSSSRRRSCVRRPAVFARTASLARPASSRDFCSAFCAALRSSRPSIADSLSCSAVGPSSNIAPSSLYERNGRYSSSDRLQPSDSSGAFFPPARWIVRVPSSASPSAGHCSVAVAMPSPWKTNSTRSSEVGWCRLRQPSRQTFDRVDQRRFVPVARSSTASAKLDLPDPFLPTTSVSPFPGASSSVDGAPMPRKPSTVIDLR